MTVLHLSRKVTSLAARDYLCSRATSADACLNKPPSGQTCVWDTQGPAGTDPGCHHHVAQEWAVFATAANNG